MNVHVRDTYLYLLLELRYQANCNAQQNSNNRYYFIFYYFIVISTSLVNVIRQLQ